MHPLLYRHSVRTQTKTDCSTPLEQVLARLRFRADFGRVYFVWQTRVSLAPKVYFYVIVGIYESGHENIFKWWRKCVFCVCASRSRVMELGGVKHLSVVGSELP